MKKKGFTIYVPDPLILYAKGYANWPKDYVTLKKEKEIREALDKIDKVLDERAEVGYEP